MGISVTGGVKFPQGKFSVYTPPPPPGYALFVWGSGSFGRLGLGDVVSQSSPVQLGALSNWASADAGGHAGSLALTDTGELWSWGYGNFGPVGDGTVIQRSSPVQVGNLTDWSSVVSGGYRSHAIKTDGSLWSWGRNLFGHLGLGDVINRSSPVQVGNLTDWSSVSANSSYGLAIKTDGTLWSWGQNNKGQLGLGNVVLRSSPVQIGGLTTWSSAVISGNGQAFAVKTDGTLWAWGNNQFGQLGFGNTTDRSSPVQIGALTDWASVSTTQTHTLALKTDGSLWAWGDSATGKLGNGGSIVIDISSPIQIGSLTDWASITTSNSHSSALKTDGSLWAWGNGSLIGLGDVINRSSPVQVGSLTTWTSINAGGSHTIGIQTT